MIMRKIYLKTMLAVLLSAFALVSCEKEQVEAFDKSATERLNERIEEIKTILTSNEEGWIMKYYIGSEQSGGGFIYTLKFTGSEAEVGFEYAETAFHYDVDTTITSLYKIADDNGPVLSFDTYNDFIHYFSTPSSSYYQALGGDFEFEIHDVSEERITMIGRRSRNTIVLEPLSQPGTEYIAGVVAMSKSFNPYYLEGMAGTETVSGTIDYSARQINIDTAGGHVSCAFCFTPSGISLYEPVELGGVEIQNLAYDQQSMKLTAGSVDIQGSVPEDWVPYDDYEGSYLLKYATNFTADVTLTPGVYNSTYILSGLNKNFTIELQYNMQTGKLVLNSQMVGTVDGYSIYFCAWALDSGGSVTWAPTAGMQTVWNGDKENAVYTFESNGYVWRTASGAKCVTDSFILFAIGDEIFYYDEASWGTNGFAQWPYIESLTKK